MTKDEGKATILATERLHLRELVIDDAPFVLELVNDPAWLRFIGDRGVRTLDDARRYIEGGPRTMYAAHGFGLWLVETLDAREPIGICGLLQRDALPDADLGFALLPDHRGKGYARESAAAVMAHAKAAFGLSRLLAITAPENERSARLLRSLGFALEEQAKPAERGGAADVYAASL